MCVELINEWLHFTSMSTSDGKYHLHKMKLPYMRCLKTTFSKMKVNFSSCVVGRAQCSTRLDTFQLHQCCFDQVGENH